MHGTRNGGLLVVGVAVALSAIAIAPASAQSDCDVSAVTSPPGALAPIVPAASADGSIVAFVSNHDFTGGNADGSFEVFVLDRTASTFLQVTDSLDAQFGGVSLSADGNRVVFASDYDPDGGNFDRNVEVWFFDREAGAITQVTSTFGSGDGNSSPVLDPAGTTIVFVSDEALVDGQNTDGNSEVLAFDLDGSTFSLVTDSPGGASRLPALASGANLVFFLSTSDLTGGNADGGEELFVVDRTTGDVRQLTSAAVAGGLEAPSPSSDGASVAFASTRDPLGDNNDLNSEVFVVDVASGVVRQVTKATGGVGSFDASLSDDASRVALASDMNLSGRNADGNVEVFRVDLADGAVAQVTDAVGATSRSPVMVGAGSSLFFLSTASSDASMQLFVADECVAAPVVKRVLIDIMPQSRENRINIDSRDTVRVAILTTRVADGDAVDFNAATVAPRSVRFGPAGARQTRDHIRMRDVDDDGDRDMIMHFRIREAGIRLGDTEACLTGLTIDGSPFEGCDMVRPFRKR